MNIQSEGSSTTLKVIRTLTSMANLVTVILVSCYILAMSYGHIPAEPMHVMFIGVIRLVFVNIYYTFATSESLQTFEEKPFATMLSNHMIFGPISLFIEVCMLWTLITGNMVGWGWYLTTVLCITVVGHIHKKHKKVKIKKWT